MTERISELLNEAVAGVEPAHPDPVAAVLRRGRVARRTSVLTAALVGAGLAAGGGVVAAQQRSDIPDPGVVGTVPAPYIDGDTVVLGQVRLPVPDGWQAVTSDQPCPNPSKTIRISVGSDGRCDTGAVEIYYTPETWVRGMETPFDNTAIAGAITVPPGVVTLPGGEPGWLQRDLDGTLKLPWAHATIMFRVEQRDHVTRWISSMRSEPAGTGALALPRDAAAADLTVGDSGGTVAPDGFGRIRDPEKIGRVLRLLREEGTVVPDAAACAGNAKQTAKLVMYPIEGVPFETLPPELPFPSPAPYPGDDTAVVIAIGGDCPEAVSAQGGRVRLSDDAVTELKTLFGIGGR